MRKEILRMEHITYCENEKTLLQDFDLNIFEGEIMGLLPIGANGLLALLKVLHEYPPLYHGYLYYRDTLVDSWVSERHMKNRISIIGDISSLVDGQSVLTNVMVLRSGFRQHLLNERFLLKQMAPFLEETGISINPYTMAEKLTPFERIVVEMLRAVVADNRLIVMKEISTIISDSEMNRLYELMRHYAKKGFSFLYISPHHEELAVICDRIALMLDKRVVKILQGREMVENAIRHCSEEYTMKVQNRLNQRNGKPRKAFFEVWNLTGQYLRKLDFSVREGECLAIQCLEQKISRELFQILLFSQIPDAGELYMDGERVDNIMDRRIAVIMEQPWESMIFPHMSVLDNLCICMDHRVPEVWHSAKVRANLRKMLEEHMGKDICERKISELTVQQKSELVYTRVLLQKPRIVFCIQPFKGEDLAHRVLIWELQKRLLDRGIAVVIMAVNMADALSLADRVIRIDNDTKVYEYERPDFKKLPSTVPWYSLYQSLE